MGRLKFLIALPLSHLFYGVGHLASKYVYWWNDRQLEREPVVLDNDWDEEPGLTFRFFWRIYQTCMAWSADISDWGNAGVWRKVDDE